MSENIITLDQNNINDNEDEEIQELEKLIKEKQKLLKQKKKNKKSKQSEPNNNNKLKCDKCGKSLSTKRQLKSHILNVCSKDNWPCHLCDTNFTSRGHLDTHINKCRKRKCPNCSFSCPNKKQLEEHIRTGKCEKTTFNCDICHKKLLSRNYLKAHYQRKHNMEAEEAKKKVYNISN